MNAESIGEYNRRLIQKSRFDEMHRDKIDPQITGALLLADILEDGYQLGRMGIDIDMDRDAALMIIAQKRSDSLAHSLPAGTEIFQAIYGCSHCPTITILQFPNDLLTSPASLGLLQTMRRQREFEFNRHSEDKHQGKASLIALVSGVIINS